MMIDNRNFERLTFELEQAARDYTKAQNEIKKIKENALNRIREVGTDGFETKEILDKMIEEVTDWENTIHWAQDTFRKA
jgi:predicted nucleotide-binding protein (sugar kinase/HSP70/actin superfamily)